MRFFRVLQVMTTPKRGGLERPVRAKYCQRLNDAGFFNTCSSRSGLII